MEDSSLFAVKTRKSKESSVAEMIVNKENEDIHSALAPEGVISYIFVESSDPDSVENIIGDIPHANKMLEGTVSMTEVESFLQPTNDVENLEEGAIVEITEGPFSGQKAEIQSVNRSNEKATVEIQEATVPIPVTLKGSQLRVLDKEGR